MTLPSILSVQSHVAVGYVGNRAAVFPLQRMGFDVIAVNTVQFSNHTGYGAWKGQIFSPEHIADVLSGIDAIGGFTATKAVLSGYLGEAALGRILLDTVKTLRQRDPSVLYCCDPVMGDVGRGFFVRPGIPEFFRDDAIRHASILTPNQFELEYLTGARIDGPTAAAEACDRLHRRGVRTVLVTSIEHALTPAGTIQMLVSDTTHGRHVATTKKLALNPAPNGGGDCTAALFCGAAVKGLAAPDALACTAAAIETVFAATAQAGTRELALIAAQDAFAFGRRVPVEAL
jgi:pyridoxine kinase